MIYNSRKRGEGFTLIEMLVAIGVFSILMTIISGIYLNVTGLQKDTASFQKLQNAGRYMMEKMAREIRGREINLSATFNGVSNPLSRLIFYKDEYGEDVILSFDSAVVRGGGAFGSLVYNSNGESDFLNAEDIEVVEAKFLVFPTVENVWGEAVVTDFQPRVTIYLKIKNRGLNQKYIKELFLQTTISGKIYNR